MTEQKELTGSPDIYLIIKNNHILRYGAEAPKYYRCTFDVKGSYWIEGKNGLLKMWDRDLSAEDVADRFETERRYLGL